MSLKFAVVGSLLGTLGTRARSENQAQNLDPVEPHDEPLLTIFGHRISLATREETRGRPGPRRKTRATGLASFSVSSAGPLGVVSGHFACA